MSRPPGHASWQRLVLALPVLMLAANALAWLRFGTDLPFYDDWTAYARGNIESLEWRRLFRAENNTMAPLGLALDALAQRWLDGNTIAYQLLSMLVVLGSLLWLQWRLLSWAVSDPSVRSVAFAFTLPMLQTHTYWGAQNLAYHQALPLVFLLTALHIILLGRWRGLIAGTLSFVLALLAGLSYISGAFAGLAAGVGLLLMAARASLDPPLRPRLRQGGTGLLMGGLLTAALQFYATRVAPDTDGSRRIPLAWPHESDFWIYLIGKVGRSFGRGYEAVGVEMAFAFALGTLLLAIAVVLAFGCWRRRDLATERMTAVYLPLFLIVTTYLSLVSLGRAGYRDPEVQGMVAVFLHAYQRFHFFWVTLLLPWLVAGLPWLWHRFSRPSRSAPGSRGPWLLGVAVAGLLLGFTRELFDVTSYYRDTGQARAADIRCFSRQLGTGAPIQCPGSSTMADWTPAYRHARQLGASFVRYLPIVEHEPPRQWLLDWPQAPVRGQLDWHQLEPVAGGPEYAAGVDPQVVFTSSDRQAFERCLILEVQVRLRPSAASGVQVFVQPRGSAGFTEIDSQLKHVTTTDQAVERHFLFERTQGFEPVLRIDPVDGVSGVQLHALRAACRLSAAD
ncbi:hypothetical protein [Ottowia beijingensis]|uniref:hypothetical protein n=1 Tax=Ottowia beijingensis TaxID=1207057 RepID=UPI002FD8ADB1